MKVRIIARKSALSQIQAQEVFETLLRKYPDLECSIIKREVAGDLDLITPLAHFDQRGVFTREFSEILESGEADVAVHSWKDLPTENKFNTEITATLPRADQRDVLLMKRDARTGAKANLKILSSSPRRAWALEKHISSLLPWEVASISCEPVRGAIPTRVQKLLDSECDGLVLAKAALDRILMASLPQTSEAQALLAKTIQELDWMVLPLRLFPNAPAQGALAIEISSKREDLKELFAAINCKDTFDSVSREREILSAYGGGCHQKIGVAIQQKMYGRMECVTGLTHDGNELNSFSLVTADTEAAQPATSRLWSSSEIANTHFDRVQLDVARPVNPTFFYVTKLQSLPTSWKLTDRDVVWTSGLATWQKLAAAGVWVNGSTESLGEQEIPDTSTYTGGTLPRLRLTHLGDVAENILTTYRIEQKEQIVIPADVTHCFWTSSYFFERALADNPHIKQAHHASGPGYTHAALQRLLGSKSPLAVYVSEQDWRAKYHQGVPPELPAYL